MINHNNDKDSFNYGVWMARGCAGGDTGGRWDQWIGPDYSFKRRVIIHPATLISPRESWKGGRVTLCVVFCSAAHKSFILSSFAHRRLITPHEETCRFRLMFTGVQQTPFCPDLDDCQHFKKADVYSS